MKKFMTLVVLSTMMVPAQAMPFHNVVSLIYKKDTVVVTDNVEKMADEVQPLETIHGPLNTPEFLDDDYQRMIEENGGIGTLYTGKEEKLIDDNMVLVKPKMEAKELTAD